MTKTKIWNAYNGRHEMNNTGTFKVHVQKADCYGGSLHFWSVSKNRGCVPPLVIQSGKTVGLGNARRQAIQAYESATV